MKSFRLIRKINLKSHPLPINVSYRYNNYLGNRLVRCMFNLYFRIGLFINIIFTIMKNFSLYTLLLAVTFMTFTACGESEAERQAREQARLDSLRLVEQQKVAAMMAELEDSTSSTESAEMEQMEEKTQSYSISESGSYVVQVGAWRSEEKAQSFVNMWSDRNYPSSYVIQTGNEATGDVWFRVRVGYFTTRDAAKEFGANLASEINSGYWVANKD